MSKSKKETAASGRKPSFRVAISVHADVSSIGKMAEELDHLTSIRPGHLTLPENFLHVKCLGFPKGKQGIGSDALLAAFKTAVPAFWLIQWYGPEWHAGIDFSDAGTVIEASLRHAVERRDDCLVFVGKKATSDDLQKCVEEVRNGVGSIRKPGLFAANVPCFYTMEEREIKDLGEMKKVTVRTALTDKLKAAMEGQMP